MKNKDLKKVLNYFNLTLKEYSNYTGISYQTLMKLNANKNELLKYDYERLLFDFIKVKKGINFAEQKIIIENVLNYNQ